jgi:uncharacterized protein (TIGR02001 family)
MFNNLKRLALVVGVVTIPATGVASTEIGDFELSANVAMTSDYVWRGVSQSGEEPAIQGGFDLSHNSGFYIGTWASNIDFDTNTQIELDLYAGFAKEFENSLSVDVGAIQYFYPGGLAANEYDFIEYYLGLGYSVAGVGLSTKYSYSPDFTATIPDASAQYIELGIEYTLPKEIVAAAHYGHSFGNAFTTPSSYDDYSLGLSKELFGLGLDVTYYDTDSDGSTLYAKNAGSRVVLTVSKSF